MKRSIGLWQFFGFGITSLGGTILHFLYDWLGEAVWIAPLSGVNESTWEHMKILFFPLFTFAVFQYRYFKSYDSFFFIKLVGISLGLILIPVIFYTYNGVIGKSPDWVNIGIFFLSAAASFVLETVLFKSSALQNGNRLLPLAALCIIGIMFVIFTFKTPSIAIFRDPVTGQYGISQ